MRLNKTLGGLFLLASLIFVPSVFAGGGGVDTRVTNTDDPHANTVIVHFDSKLFTCKGMNVSFNFETPEDGDMIEGTNGNNTSTITQEAWMAKGHLKCFTYAKVYSKELKRNRILNISFKGANLEGSREIAISFGVTYNPNDLPFLPWESSSDPQPISTPTTEVLPVPTTTPFGKTTKPADTVELQKAEQPIIVEESNNKELEQKIANLEAQLTESKQKQSFLEQRINDLVNFIKKLFPFFK